MKKSKKCAKLVSSFTKSQRLFRKFLLSSLCAVAIACPTGAWGIETWLVGIKKENSDPALLQEALTIYDGQKGGGTWQLDNTGGVITEDTWVIGARSIYNGHATAKMSGNGSLTISNSSSTTTKNIYGGFATGYTASAMDNKLTISDIKVKENIRGGSAIASTGEATANSNFVIINSGVSFVEGSDHSLAGGYSEASSGEADSSSNTLKILDNNFTFPSTSYGVYGGYSISTGSSSTANNNTLEISGGTFTNSVCGGYANGTDGAYAAMNSVEINGGTFTPNGRLSGIFSGMAYSESNTASAVDNTMTISDGYFTCIISAGFARSPENFETMSSDNSLTINGGTFVGSEDNTTIISAGYASSQSHGTVSGNTLTISGGQFIGDGIVYISPGAVDFEQGATSESIGTYSNNTLILTGTPNLTSALLDGTAFVLHSYEFLPKINATNNTLEIHTSGLKAVNIQDFHNYVFALPKTIKENDVVLTLTGGVTDLTNSTVSIAVSKGTGLTQENSFILIANENGITGMNTITQGEITGEPGIAEEYNFTLDTTTDLTKLIANITQTQIQEVIGSKSTLSKSLVIDKNGKTDNRWGQYSGISITDHYVFGVKDNKTSGDALATMSGDGSLTIQGTGSGSPKMVYGTYAVTSSGKAVAKDAKLTISDGTFTMKVYGGYANGTDGTVVTGNTIAVSQGTFEANIDAGYAYSKDSNTTAHDNTFTISNGTFKSYVTAGSAISYSSTATAHRNSMIVTGGTFTKEIDSGYAYSKNNNATAHDNTFTISNGTFENYVTAGSAISDSSTATAHRNSMIVTGGTFSKEIDAGSAYSKYNNATAHDNTFTISKGTFESYVTAGSAISDSSTATANSNTLIITGGTFKSDTSAGYAYSTGNVTAHDNTITISNGTFEYYVFGGYAGTPYSTATAYSNKITVLDGTFNKEIESGYASSVNDDSFALDNIISISNGTFNALVIGGYAEAENKEATASNNIVTVNGGTFSSKIIGGYTGPDPTGSVSAPLKAIATDNKVTISGGTFGTSKNKSEIYAGYASAKEDGVAYAVNNTLILERGIDNTNPNPEYATLYGGYTKVGSNEGNGISTGNTLEIRTTDLKAQNVAYFQNYAFMLPNTVKNNDVVLTLVGKDKTDISGNPTISIGVESGSTLYLGNNVILLKNAHGLISTGFTQDNEKITVEQGIALEYGFGLSVNDKELVATVTKAVSSEKSKAPTEAQTVAPAMLNQAADLVAGEAMQSLTAMPAGGTMGTFGVASAGNLRHNSGSHTNIKGVSTLIGVGKRFEPSYGIIYTGAFFEYGYGDYSAHNDFSTGYVRGDGHSRYYGGGVMARYDIPCGFYAEGSLRFGGLDTYWSSKELGASYDSDGMYFGAHVALGYICKFAKDFKLDVYSKYFYSYQEGDKVNILGDTFDFDSVNSNRLRLGARLGYDFCEMLAGFVGAGWEREFSGSANASVYGYDIVAPSLRGNSGIFEGGLSFKPKKGLAFSTDIGITGYVGQKKGVTGYLKLNYSF